MISLFSLLGKMAEQSNNKFLKIYLLIISLVGVIGISVMVAITMNEA